MDSGMVVKHKNLESSRFDVSQSSCLNGKFWGVSVVHINKNPLEYALIYFLMYFPRFI